MEIILASKSPRRKELLSLITKDFQVIVSSADEIVDKTLTPEEQVKAISLQKADNVMNEILPKQEDFILIASDTIVVSQDNEILGKPKDEEDAKRMLRKISGDIHEVMTGLAIFIQKDGVLKQHISVDIAEVHVNVLSEEEIQKWLDTGNAWDKAGAYAIQQEFGIHIDKINGSYATVMGLPIHKVYEVIKDYLK